jgi:hypothetical protein
LASQSAQAKPEPIGTVAEEDRQKLVLFAGSLVQFAANAKFYLTRQQRLVNLIAKLNESVKALLTPEGKNC